MIPELWTNFYNMEPTGKPIWSFMFITVACGAISGFHATQSPLMARCMKSERQGHMVFYGAMVCEGVIALIWAAAGCSIYEVVQGKSTGLQAILANGQSAAIYDVLLQDHGRHRRGPGYAGRHRLPHHFGRYRIPQRSSDPGRLVQD